MRYWFGDRLFRRALLLALSLGALTGLTDMLTSRPDLWRDSWGVTAGIMIGAAAMRLWTWKGKP